MKKLITVLLSSLLLPLLLACSTDDEVPNIDGLYQCNLTDYNISVLVRVRACKAESIIIEDDGRQYVWQDLHTSGSYPDYTYSREGFTASFHYVEAGATAVLDGILRHETIHGPTGETRNYTFTKLSANFQQIKNDI